MPPTKMTAAVRFFRPETTKVYWVRTMTTYTAPTRTELNAGTDITDDIAEISGFQVTSASIDTPDLASRFSSKIPGRITADDSSINFYASSTGLTPASSVMPRDTTGFLVIMDAGDVSTTGRMDVFPCTVGSVAKLRDVENPSMVQVQYYVTKKPAEDVVIPV